MLRSIIIVFVLVLFVSKAQSKEFLGSGFRAIYAKHFVSIKGERDSSKGSIEYQYPGKLRMIDNKTGTEVVTNGRKFWSYSPPYDPTDPDMYGQLSVSNAENFPLTKILDDLQKGLANNDTYKVKKETITKKIKVKEKVKDKMVEKTVTEVTDFYKLTLSDRIQKELEFQTVEIYFKKNAAPIFKNVSKLTLVTVSGTRENYELEGIEASPKFSKTHFIFKAPKGVKIEKI